MKMKQLTCEMCGSTDLMKQDGVFVCQLCGMKYSVEEAKKMMVEETINVVGTVSIDNSASYDRIIELARDAYNDKRFDSAYDYYCQAVDIRQDVFENVLRQGLSILAKDHIHSSIPSSCIGRVDRAIGLLKKMPEGEERNKVVLSALDDLESACTNAEDLLQEEEDILDAQKMATRSPGDILADLGRPAFVASQNQAEDKRIERHNNAIQEKIYAVWGRNKIIRDFHSEYVEKIVDCADVNFQFKYWFEDDSQKAAELYPRMTLDVDEQKKLLENNNHVLFAVKYHKIDVLEMLYAMGENLNRKGSSYVDNKLQDVSPLFAITAVERSDDVKTKDLEVAKWLIDHGLQIDLDEKVGERTLLNSESNEEIKKIIIEKYPEMKDRVTTAPAPTSSGGGCYVATAVYGSYDCPQVWTLRRYRDYTLSKTWYGRTFVRTYYAVSPTLVKWFGHTERFKKMWKGKLDRMVAELQAEGVESTPYEDMVWK